MRIFIFSIFLFVALPSGFAQKKLTETDSSRIIETDSSVIKIQSGYSGGRTVQEYFKDRNLINYQFYGAKFLITQGMYDSSEQVMGLWKEYDPFTGQLIRMEDYDKRTWRVIDYNRYPHKDLLDTMKVEADSILISWYGQDFFEAHVRWSIDGSYIFDNKGKLESSWTEPTTIKPARFLMRYDIRFDYAHMYDEMIEFEMNAKGKLIVKSNDDIKGFDKLHTRSAFRLTYESAIDKAKLLGLQETDSTKAEGLLFWEAVKTKGPQVSNGSFRFYVLEHTGTSIKNSSNAKYQTIINHYNVYVFNPWTGGFILKKEMKATGHWKGNDGSVKLVPDE